MSTAANHRKRSHRSEYRARPYRGGTRTISMQPTVRKRSNFGLIRLIRQAMAKRMATRAAKAAASQTTTQHEAT